MPALRDASEKRLCACGCGRLHTRKTERRHLSGQGPSKMTSTIAAQYRSLIRSNPSRRNTSSPRSRENPVGRSARTSRSLLANPHTPDHPHHHVHDDPGTMDMEIDDPEPLESTSNPSHLSNSEEYGLSNLRRSRRVADHVEKFGRQRWGNDHTRHFIDEEESDEEESNEEDRIGDHQNEDMDGADQSDDEVYDDDNCEYDIAQLGQEGVSVWDLLGESFLKEASRIEDRLDQKDIDLLRYYAFKIEDSILNSTFNKFRYVFPYSGVDTLKNTEKRIQFLSGFQPVHYHSCPSSCILYVGPYESLKQCPHCGLSRYKVDGITPQSHMEYLPFTPRLRAMVASRPYATKMKYRSQRQTKPGEISDIFDGAHYCSLLRKFITIGDEELPSWFFSDPRDIALGLSTDGFCPFKRRSKTSWPLILFNYNLSPKERFKKGNVIPLGAIPGPNKPLDMDSYFWPVIQEFITLQIGVSAFDALTEEVFLLRAHLIVVFGDIPAISTLMRMKGHTGISACRMCTIQGIRIPSSPSPAHYFPLHRNNFPGAPENYDPSALPLRDHESFMEQAREVQNAPTEAESERLATQYGIKGIPLLSTLSSLSFPTSFPYDFMHLIWSNLIPNLIRLWTGKFKNLPPDPDYVFPKTVWEAIGEATAKAGKTIPAAFGSRVPNVAAPKGQITAEAYSIWTFYIAPTLLKGRFQNQTYYTHFIKLFKLLSICLQYEISEDQLNDLEQGFKDWVQGYERLYYKHDPLRASTCPITVHGLLHIAPSIRATGPVWAYWAFPTERHCGDIGHHIKSRRFPYASINRYITSVAQLTQIKLLYNVEIRIIPPPSRSQDFTLPTYPLFVLTPPRGHTTALSRPLWVRLTATLATRLDKSALIIRKLIPQNTEFAQYGRVVRLEGGDIMRASQIGKLKSDSRDMSFVRYQLMVDIHAHQRNQRPVFELQDFFGQLLQFIVIDFPASPEHEINRQSFIYAIIKQVKTLGNKTDRRKINYYKDLGAIEIVDINQIVCLVGRIFDRKRWAIIDRNSSLEQVHNTI